MSRDLLPLTIKGRRQKFSLDTDPIATLMVNFPQTAERRAEIEDLCLTYIIDMDFQRGSIKSKLATDIYEGLLAATSDINDRLAEVKDLGAPHFTFSRCLTASLATWYPTSKDPFDEVQRTFRLLFDATLEAANAHLTERCGRGRPALNEPLRDFIWQLMNLFEDAGIKARAWYSGSTGKRNSPFVRFVRTLNACLPERSKADPKKLPELIHEVYEARPTAATTCGVGRSEEARKAIGALLAVAPDWSMNVPEETHPIAMRSSSSDTTGG
jgi:hypothetical protein